MPRKSLRERLIAKIDDSGGPDACWPWRGISEQSYGKIRDDNNILQRANRMIWTTFVGPIPQETPEVLHSCDKPYCSNLRHYFLGTQGDNVRDMDRKGRRNFHVGYNDPQALSPGKVREIVGHLKDLNKTCRDVSILTGVGESTIARIAKGERYQDITPIKGRTFWNKTTPEQVKKVKDLLVKGLPQRLIAKEVGISQMSVSRIARLITYKDWD